MVGEFCVVEVFAFNGYVVGFEDVVSRGIDGGDLFAELGELSEGFGADLVSFNELCVAIRQCVVEQCAGGDGNGSNGGKEVVSPVSLFELEG